MKIPESQDYFKALGANICLLRKSHGLTQAELARAIGVSQQAVFAYELGERRVSVFLLIRIARVFSTSLEELAGMTRPLRVPKTRVSPRAKRHAQRLQALTKTEQRFVVRIIDTLHESHGSARPGSHHRIVSFRGNASGLPLQPLLTKNERRTQQ